MNGKNKVVYTKESLGYILHSLENGTELTVVCNSTYTSFTLDDEMRNALLNYYYDKLENI